MRTGVRAATAAIAVAVLTSGLAAALGPEPAFAAPTITAATPARMMPSAVPSANTPAVDNGEVMSIAQVGNTMVLGGTFTSVAGANHSYVVAFDATTGAVSGTFAPALNGLVNSVIPGPQAGTVYVGGQFTQVNGVADQFVALLDVTTGQPVAGFHAPSFNWGYVNNLVLKRNRLYLAGVFTQVNGVEHDGLATLNPTTGALDPFMNVQLTGHHNDSGSGAQGWIGAFDLAVTPTGGTLAVVGNFKNADGQLRNQAALINIAGSHAVLDPWATTGYAPLCFSNAFDQTVRDVAFAPDGSYFVITTTGGGNPGTLCDAATRFNTDVTNPNAQPAWVDQSGGDSLWGVAITNTAIFVGGHNRWMNNPFGVDAPQPGAVPRAGLQALDPISGRPLAWNPGRVPLGVAVFAFLATSQGLWLGSDTDYIGNFAYHRPKLAMFPWTGGYRVASTRVATLPGRVFLGGSGAPDGLTRVAYDGTTATPTTVSNQGIDFSHWHGAFLVGRKVFYGYTDGYLYSRTFNGTKFGAPVQIDPYHDPAWANVNTGDGDTFDGALPDFYQHVTSLTGMVYAQGRLYFTLAGDPHLYSAWFSPDSGIVDETIATQSSSVDFSGADGLFAAGGFLYYGSSQDASLRRVAFAGGTVSGGATVVSGPGHDAVRWTSTALFLAAASGVPADA